MTAFPHPQPQLARVDVGARPLPVTQFSPSSSSAITAQSLVLASGLLAPPTHSRELSCLDGPVQVQKEQIKYARADGLMLDAELYLPVRLRKESTPSSRAVLHTTPHTIREHTPQI